ncbi:uncharacterized protein LOC135495498 [Lineus longissimus]|uniref:uncharacterized protein LOC135495498 n=1 Tax=Lineus longissimus TaxID=88925 RepID=UPI00315C6DE2
MAHQQAADDKHTVRRSGLILHPSDYSREERPQTPEPQLDKERKFVGCLKDELLRQNINLKTLQWTPETGVDNPEHVKKLVEIQEHHDHNERIILAFPGSFVKAQLVQAVNMIVKRKCAFVTVIMYQNEYIEFPHDLDAFKVQRILVNRPMKDIEGIVGELKNFIIDNPEDLKLAFLNFGNGLAWSYFFGYLSPMLPDLENIIMQSPWRKGVGKDVPVETISKKMLIYPKVEIKKGDLSLGRLIFHKNEVQVNRAGIDRRYEIDIREVKSQDQTETYYGIADYAKCLQMLIKLRGGLFDMSEEMMVKQGKYFRERLWLFLYGGCMRKYNEKYNIHPSKFQLMSYDTPRKASEDQLVEDLFQRTKEACRPRSPPTAAGEVPTEEIGIICLPHVKDVIKRFVGELQDGASTRDLLAEQEFDSTLHKLKKVFMVLTDELVTSDRFEDIFYTILRHGYDVNDRRLLVCLDCLTSATASHPALQLLLLFKRISFSDPEWEHKVKTELEGVSQEITYDLMFHNIGAGFALSFYYGYLHFKIPSMKNVVAETPELRKKFEDRLMSYKLFILHPHTCQVQKKVSDADSNIIDRDDDEELKNITFKDITHDRRDYSPKMSSIVDPATGKKYFVFVEYNTQAETLRRMMKEGFLDEALLSAEWERFSNKLNQLIVHPNETLGCKNRMQIIRYDDTTVTDLAETILDKVKQEIQKENGVLDL